MTTKTKSVWERLSKIDVNEHTEKKGNLTYLSWAWAWSALKEQYPNASFEKHWFEMGDPRYKLPYAIDKQGYSYVMVSVTVEGEKVTEVFPVLDHRNNSVKTPNSFQINTSLQRALAKAIAYHGLGAYIYAGEDTAYDVDKEDKEEKRVEEEERQAIIDESKEDTPSTLTTEQWRASFLDHPEKPVKQDDAGSPVVEAGTNAEGWKLVQKVFEVFMPRADDKKGKTPSYKTANDCVQAINNFYTTNKGTLNKMKKEVPEIYEEVLKKFKHFKALASKGEKDA
jgi:hypothetical protein